MVRLAESCLALLGDGRLRLVRSLSFFATYDLGFNPLSAKLTLVLSSTPLRWAASIVVEETRHRWIQSYALLPLLPPRPSASHTLIPPPFDHIRTIIAWFIILNVFFCFVDSNLFGAVSSLPLLRFSLELSASKVLSTRIEIKR